MRRKKTIALAASSAVFFLLYFFLDLQLVYLFQIVVAFVEKQAKTIESSMGWVVSFVMLATAAKGKFWDNRFFKKMEHEHGKFKIRECQSVILQLLAKLTPEEIVRRVLKTDNIDIEIRSAIQDIHNAMYNIKVEDWNLSDEKLDRTTRKALSLEIKAFLKMIDKQLEIHYYLKEAKIGKFKDIVSKGLNDTIEKIKDRVKKCKEVDEKVSARGKQKIVEKLSSGL